MADPLSIAASIAGLVSLTDTLFRTVIKFSREVKNSKQEITNLATEIRDLSGTLHSLSLLASSLETGTEEMVFRLHHVNSCRQSVLTVQAKLSKAVESLQSKKTAISITRRLLWPYTSNETKTILGDISRHKNTMTLALAADSMKSMMQCLSNLSDLDQKVSAIEVNVKEAKEIATSITMDKRRKEILDFFLVVNPQRNLDVSLRLRHPLTGLWLTDSEPFKQWIETPNAKLWLSGIPGAGKTILAGLIIQDILQLTGSTEAYGICFFFCDYKDPASHLLVNILSSLASQLARQSDRAFQILEAYYESLHPRHGMTRSPDEEEMSEVFLEMARAFGRVYVVVDGLDECGMDPSVVVGFHSIVSSTVSLSMVILSRDELHIRERLEDGFEHIEIAAQSGDIQLFVAAELELRVRDKRLRIRNVELKDEVMHRLVKGAKGMFRWVTCQIDYLCLLPTDRDIREALDKLPPTLPATYERILRRERHPRAIQIIRTALKLISLTDVPLEIGELCDAVSVPDGASSIAQEDIVQEDDIARLCGSLVRKSLRVTRLSQNRLVSDSEDLRHCYELAHFTVKEFLQSPDLKETDLGVYFIDPSEDNGFTTAACLRFLCLDNFDIKLRTPKEALEATDEVTRRHPFYSFASSWWLYPSTISRSQQGSVATTSYKSDISNCTREEKPPGHLELLLAAPKSYRVPQMCFDLALKLFACHRARYFTLWCVKFLRLVTEGSKLNDSQQDMCELISWVIHPNFSSLHMACILNLPSITDALLKAGADIEQQCALGSVFQCAVLGILCFVGKANSGRYWRLVREAWFYGDCIETLMVLNKYKSSCDHWVSHGESTLSMLQAPFVRFDDSIMAVFALLYCLTKVFQVPPTTEFIEGLRIWTSDLSGVPHVPYYLSHIVEPIAELTNDTTLANELRGAVKVALRGHSSYSGELACPQKLPETDSGYFQNICTALQYDDIVLLKEMALDSRIWNLHKWHNFNATALHVAAYHGSTGAIKFLIGIGFDVDCRDRNNWSPLHYCCRPFSLSGRSFQFNPPSSKSALLLLESGASDTIVDDRGNSIWHLAASIPWDKLIKELLKRDADRGPGLALITTNDAGLNPAGVALSKKHICTATLLIPHFGNQPGLFNHSVRPYHIAAERNSEELIQALVAVEVSPNPKSWNSAEHGTPLHFVNPHAISLQCVRRLKSLFPQCCIARFKGLTPFETFIIRLIGDDARVVYITLEDGALLTFVEKNTLVELIPEELSYQTEEGRALWEFLCQRWSSYEGLSGRLLHVAIYTLLALVDCNFISLSGQADEEALLLSNYFNTLRRTLLASPSVYDTSHLQELILPYFGNQGDCSWSSRSPDWVLTLFEMSVLLNWGDIATTLQARGLSVSGRSGARHRPMSAIEAACLGSSRCSPTLLEKLLDNLESKTSLNEHNPSYGMSPIHFLVSGSRPWADESIRAKKLGVILRHGADPNLTMVERHEPAIVSHLVFRQVKTAWVLLRYGVEPSLANSLGIDTILALVWNSDVEGLAEIKDQFGDSVDWAKRCSLDSLFPRWAKVAGLCNALHLACLQGSMECVKFLVESTPLSDVNSRSGGGYTCAHFAASVTDNGETILKYLQTHGADINARNHLGRSPLHMAVWSGRKHSVRALLLLGAVLSTDSSGFTPVAEAFAKEDWDMTEIFETHAPFVSESVNVSKAVTIGLLPALQKAIDEADLEACQRLQQMGCPLDHPLRSCNQCTPLLLALRCGSSREYKDIVLWLVKSDGGAWAKVCPSHDTITTQRTKGGLGPVQFALQDKGFDDILECLLDKYERFWPEWLIGTVNEPSALQVAIDLNNLDGLKVLLDWVRKRHGQGNSSGSAVPSLHHILNAREPVQLLCQAASKASRPCINLLVEYGASVDVRDRHGATPLHVAIRCRKLLQVECLLEHGASLGSFNNQGVHPLEDAVVNGDISMVNLLVSHGADVGLSQLNRFPLFARCCTRRTAQYLLSLGVDPWARDWQEYPAIFHVLHNSHDLGHFVLQKSLIQGHRLKQPMRLEPLRNPNLDITPILRKMIRILGRKSVKSMINTEPIRSISPLCGAILHGYLDLVKTLVDIGADLEFEGHHLGTALMVASASGQLEIVRFLVSRGARIQYTRNRVQEGGQFNNTESSSAVDLAVRYPYIRRWFLVERWTEQLKLECSTSQFREPHTAQPGEPPEVRPWSGIRHIECPLIGDRARPSTSSIAYLRYLYWLKRSLRGQVVYYSKIID